MHFNLFIKGWTIHPFNTNYLLLSLLYDYNDYQKKFNISIFSEFSYLSIFDNKMNTNTYKNNRDIKKCRTNSEYNRILNRIILWDNLWERQEKKTNIFINHPDNIWMIIIIFLTKIYQITTNRKLQLNTIIVYEISLNGHYS